MAYKINEDLYIGNTNTQLKDLLVSDVDTLPIGAIVDFDGSTIPDGYARYIDPNIMSETILFDTNTWDSMMKRYETKNIDFTSYTYVEVHFTGQGDSNSTNTILKIDLTKPFKIVITNNSVSYSYGASVCYPDIQLLQGSNNDPGIFRIGACISTDKKKIWMGDPGYFAGQTNSGNFDANSIYSRISKIVGFKPTIRIKKIQQPASYPENSIYDAYSTSTTDTYSCNYLNKSAITVISNNQYHTGNKWSIIQIKVTSSNSVGNGFSRSGNYIVINKPMKGVLVSAALSLTEDSYSYSGDLYAHLYDTSGKTRAVCQFRTYPGSYIKYCYIPPVVWSNLQPGEKIDFGHYTGGADDSFTTTNDYSTHLTVQEL